MRDVAYMVLIDECNGLLGVWACVLVLVCVCG